MRSTLAVIVACALIACESVPDLSFATVASDAAARDGADDGADDTGALVDASTDAANNPDGDASEAAATCAVSAIYGSCCGAMPCSGNCGTTNCAMCTSTCATNQFCCVKPNNRVTCNAADTAPCP
jgi:hypothetical protein